MGTKKPSSAPSKRSTSSRAKLTKQNDKNLQKSKAFASKRKSASSNVRDNITSSNGAVTTTTAANVGKLRATGSIDARNSSIKSSSSSKRKKGSLLPSIAANGLKKRSSSVNKKAATSNKRKSDQVTRSSSSKRKSAKGKSTSHSTASSGKKRATHKTKLSKKHSIEQSLTAPRAKRKVTIAFSHLLDGIIDNETELRATITAEEELERDNYIPIYNVLVM